MFRGSKADLRLRMRTMSERVTVEPEEESCRLETGATKSGPQILTWHLS